MNNILVSWYGITDLRCSLGYENCGPLLAALRADQYQQVHVLQYVDKEKSATEDEVTAAALGLPPGSTQYQFVTSICNTPAANRHFLNWLTQTARQEKLCTRIVGHEVCLNHLNDSDGIYNAAVAILDKLVTEPDVSITLDISPGTAVMAFVWAFASLRYPGVKIRLITSPQSSCPPQEVPIPAGLRNLHERAPIRSLDEAGVQDVVYHMFGDQRMPSLLGLVNFSSRKHVFITTAEYDPSIMSDLAQNCEIEELKTDAFDSGKIMADLTAHLASQPAGSRIVFNLTGGTKIMFACALEVARKHNVLPIYFDIKNSRIINLLDFSSKPTKAGIPLPYFIYLNSVTRLKRKCLFGGLPVENEERRRLSAALRRNYCYKEYTQVLYPPLQDNYRGARKPFEPVTTKNFTVELTKEFQAKARFSNGEEYSIPNWRDYADFLTGGWFEEYVYHFVLTPLREAGLITDARLNLVLEEESGNREVYQEMDAVFTEGRRLYIVECKSGTVKGEHIEKLSSIVRSYGGTSGKGILCYMSNRPPRKTVQKKAEATKIVLCHVDDLDCEIRKLLQK